jgi:hypothetical protein
MPIGATCLAHRCGQEQAGLNTNETLFFFLFIPFALAGARAFTPIPTTAVHACMVHGMLILFLSSCRV